MCAELSELDHASVLPFSLGEREFELFWLTPIEQGIAVLGLADKLNGPAALRTLELRTEMCRIALADGGELLVWADRAPRSVEAAGGVLPFRYEPKTCALRVALSPAQARDVSLYW